MALKGALYGIQIGSDFIECEMDCEIAVNRELLPTSNETSGQAKSFRYGYYEWSFTVNAKAFYGATQGSFNKIIKAQVQGTPIKAYLKARQSSTQQISLGGNILIPNSLITFPSKGQATATFTFQGSGILEGVNNL